MRMFAKEINNALKRHLSGLPGFCRLVIYDLFEYCDFSTGIITLPALEVLAQNDFHVEPTSGRKKEIIDSDALRNAFRTIKKAKPDHFKFSVKNQRVVIEMPFIRELYLEFFPGSTEVAAEEDSAPQVPTTLARTEKSRDLEAMIFLGLAGEDAAATCEIHNPACAEGIFNILNKKQTTTTTAENNLVDCSLPRPAPIADDFMPNAKTIATARARGYQNPDDLSEIRAFIDYNQAHGKLFTDFNPVYLRWLSLRETNQQKAKTNPFARRENYASSKQHQPGKQSAINRVKEAYGRHFQYDENTGFFRDRSAHAAF